MTEFQEFEKKEILKALFCVAWADRVLKEEEREVLSSLLEIFELTELQKGEMARYLLVSPTIEEIDWSVIPESGRYFLLTCAWGIAICDHELDRREEEIIVKMTTLMGLKNEDYLKIKEGKLNDEQELLIDILGLKDLTLEVDSGGPTE